MSASDIAERARQPSAGGERDLLLGWLAFHRGALAAKCEGLSSEQLVQRSEPPSNLSLAGLVRHMSEMERAYIHAAVAGGRPSLRYCSANRPEGDFDDLRSRDARPSLAAWSEDIRLSDEFIAQWSELDAVIIGTTRSVRWHLLKLINEYARHNGHADILRERIDGLTGE